jgi:hypothetical protein
MGDIVNLRQARKAKKRDARKSAAAANRAAFGRSKAEKGLTGARADKARRDLDRKRRERPEEP